MLETVFLKVFNMSFTARFVILIVLAARVLLKKLPKIYSYLLWSVVLIRLLIPVSVQSMFSLLPVNSMPITKDLLFSQEPQSHTGLEPMDRIVNSIDSGEAEQLILTENHASLPEANLYFSLTDGIKNAEPITGLLEDSIYEHSVPLGETIEGSVVFLHTAGSREPLVFAGFGTVVEFRFQEK